MSPANDSWVTMLSNSIIPAQIKLNMKHEYFIIPANRLLCITCDFLISYNPYLASGSVFSIVLVVIDETLN